jgi:hypothetical protein
MDADGKIWARVRFINDSSLETYWNVWNCRTAVESTAGTAVTDFSGGWDTIVEAGASEYVWVYGDVTERDEAGAVINVLNLEVGIASDDGITYRATSVPVDGGDGELVITIAPDGSISASIDTTAGSYGPPSRSGS